MPSTRKKPSMTLQELERLVGYSVKQAVSEYQRGDYGAPSEWLPRPPHKPSLMAT
jgi:hypothetical protein